MDNRSNRWNTQLYPQHRDIRSFHRDSIQRGDWPLLLPAEHLWHFTEKALEILLKETKYKIIFTEKASGVWDFENPLKELFNSLFNFKKRFFSEIITALPSFIISKTGVGSDLMVIAIKN